MIISLLHTGFMSTEELAKMFNVEVVTFWSHTAKYYKQLASYCDFTKVEGGVIITRLKF